MYKIQRSHLAALGMVAVSSVVFFPHVAGATTEKQLPKPVLKGATNRTSGAAGHVISIHLTMKNANTCAIQIAPKLAFITSGKTSCRSGKFSLDIAIGDNTTAKSKVYRVGVGLVGDGGTTTSTFLLTQVGTAISTTKTSSTKASSAPSPAATPAAPATPTAVVASPVATTSLNGGTPAVSAAAQCPTTTASNGGTPSSVGYCQNISFGAYGNTTWGDCTLASAADLEQAFNSETGQSTAQLSTDAIIQEYQQLSGATPQNPNVAVANATLIHQWEQGGVASTYVNDWAQITTTDDNAIEKAMWQLGGLYTTVGLPQADYSGSAGSTWSLASTPPGTPTVQDHAMALVGYDTANVYFVAYGHLQAATWGWWNTFSEIAVGVLPSQFVTAGHGPVLSVAQEQAAYF